MITNLVTLPFRLMWAVVVRFQRFFAGLGVLGIIAGILLGVSALGFSVYCFFDGIVLNFHAALWTGIVGLLPWFWAFDALFGLIHVFGGPNIAHLIVSALG